ncbi:hypothetical protein HGRIS_004410 [Hohenbuehelia grisea]|uniref:Uncharacterized protein n=1 Tax=Hohenbuehelia grisea TaxID=104357 RepID=A0ABR3JC21_9AGAR
MLQLANFFAWIEVDNEELPQHRVVLDKNGRRAACWIASVPGKNFEVVWKDSLGLIMTSGNVSIDGISCGGRFNYPVGHEHYREGRVCRKDYVRTEGEQTRKIEFPEKDQENELDSHHGMGKITLDIYEYNIFGQETRSLAEQAQLIEFQKKAVQYLVNSPETFAHKAHLSKEVDFIEKAASIDGEYGQLMFQFEFKYAPLDVLYEMGVALMPAIELKRKRDGTETPEDMEDMELQYPEPEELEASAAKMAINRQIGDLEARLEELRAQEQQLMMNKVTDGFNGLRFGDGPSPRNKVRFTEEVVPETPTKTESYIEDLALHFADAYDQVPLDLFTEGETAEPLEPAAECIDLTADSDSDTLSEDHDGEA